MGIKNSSKIKLVRNHSADAPDTATLPFVLTPEELTRIEAAEKISSGIVRWTLLEKFEPLLKEEQLRSLYPKLRRRMEKLHQLGMVRTEPYSFYYQKFNTPHGSMSVRVTHHINHVGASGVQMTNWISKPFYSVELLAGGGIHATAQIIDGYSDIDEINNSHKGRSYYEKSNDHSSNDLYSQVLGQYLASLNYDK